MIYLVFYDIADSARRTKVAKRLIQLGFERLQYSVFSGLENLSEIPQAWNFFKNQLDKKTDKLYVLRVSKASLKSMDIIGVFSLDLDYLSGDTDSLFI